MLVNAAISRPLGGGMGYTYTSGCASSSPLQGNSGGNGDYPPQHVTGGGGGAGGPGGNAQQSISDLAAIILMLFDFAEEKSYI